MLYYYLITGFKEGKNTLFFLSRFSFYSGRMLAAQCVRHALFQRAHDSPCVELLICGPLLVISFKPQNISRFIHSILAYRHFCSKTQLAGLVLWCGYHVVLAHTGSI